MIYFKDKEQYVYAYTKSNIEQVSRLTELEMILSEKEHAYTDAYNVLQAALLELNEAIARYDLTIASEELNEDVSEFENDVNVKTANYNIALVTFSKIESEYLPIKSEYDEIPSVFFEIRENINVMKKMSQKEVDVYLNPPISKKQLIAETEQQKQSLLAEANNAIAPLQDAVDLGMPTESETAALQEWKKYRVLLNRVDTSTAPDIEWPVKPNI
ncbi:tail fiber assembly protein [Providencia manganoxydans]|uniref:tail fiber assembly protein n=1 Tax=Providencia manganoxydans TaxID=2923283 RepID=UPI0034DD46B9